MLACYFKDKKSAAKFERSLVAGGHCIDAHVL